MPPPARRTGRRNRSARAATPAARSWTDDIHAGQLFRRCLCSPLLDRGLYRADGQMQDEVFNHGSFLQSRMFAKGVTCSNCHEPHSQKLRAEWQRAVRPVP